MGSPMSSPKVKLDGAVGVGVTERVPTSWPPVVGNDDPVLSLPVIHAKPPRRAQTAQSHPEGLKPT